MNSEDCMGHSNPVRLPFFFLIPSLEKGWPSLPINLIYINKYRKNIR